MWHTDKVMNNLTTQRAAYPMKEACALLGGVSRQHLYNLEAKGLIRIVRLGHRALIPADEIRRLVGERPNNDPTSPVR